MVIVGGEVSESESDGFAVGTPIAVLVKDGDPDEVGLWFEDPPTSGSCSEVVENIPEEVLSEPRTLEPIDGDITTG